MAKIKKPQQNLKNKSAPKVSAHRERKKRTFYTLITILVVVTFAAFANALQNEFLTWDDKDYVTENNYIKDFSPSGIVIMFKVFVSCHYHPLTLVSLAFDFFLWGQNPTGFIFTNILLHILSTVLLFSLINKFSKNHEVAFITALLFAIHPLKTESVIWIAERKDVLFSLFYFLALLFYITYLKNNKQLKYYFATLIIFIISLFSKATAVSLPLVLILFDFYLGRKDIKTIVIEKIPFFLLSLVFGLLAIKAQSLALPNNPPLFDRIFLITYALSFYLFKFFAPFYQSALIPFPESTEGLLPLKYYLSFLIIPALGFIVYKFKSYRKEILFALGFFLLTLILVLIKFPIGPAYLAERYTYIPYIGLGYFVGLAYYKYKTDNKLGNNFKNLFFIVLLFYSLFFFIKTINRNLVWNNSISLFSDVVAKNPTHAYALSIKGNALSLKNKHIEAIKEYDTAIQNKPDFVDAYNNRATSFFALKEFEKVVADLNISIELSPDNEKIASMHHNRGLAYFNLKQFDKAILDFDVAIGKDPIYLDAYKSRMNCYIEMKEFDKALSDLKYIISVDAGQSENFNQMGIINAEKGDFNTAVESFSTAIQMAPDNSSYYINRAYVYLNFDISKACNDFSKSASLNNTTAQEMLNLYCRK